MIGRSAHKFYKPWKLRQSMGIFFWENGDAKLRKQTTQECQVEQS